MSTRRASFAGILPFAAALAVLFAAYGAAAAGPPSGNWALVYGKGPYYTHWASVASMTESSTTYASYTFWTLQVPPFTYKWNSSSRTFEDYTTVPNDTEKNVAYKAKTRKFLTDAPRIVFLCLGATGTNDEFAATQSAIDAGVECNESARLPHEGTSSAPAQVSYTGYELLCIKKLGALDKTRFFELKPSGDWQKPEDWVNVSRCTGAGTDYWTKK